MLSPTGRLVEEWLTARMRQHYLIAPSASGQSWMLVRHSLVQRVIWLGNESGD